MKYITEPKDWYFVSRRQIVQHGGHGLLQYYYNGSLIRALQSVYPDHPWHTWRFSSRSPHFSSSKGRTRFSKNQYLLYQHIQNVSIQCWSADLVDFWCTQDWVQFQVLTSRKTSWIWRIFQFYLAFASNTRYLFLNFHWHSNITVNITTDQCQCILSHQETLIYWIRWPRVRSTTWQTEAIDMQNGWNYVTCDSLLVGCYNWKCRYHNSFLSSWYTVTSAQRRYYSQRASISTLAH